MSNLTRRARVLLVEDSEDDAFFFNRTIRRCGVDCDLQRATDGVEAVRHLSAARTAAEQRPEVVFLDLKLPRLNGFEVLEWLQSHPFNPPLRVVVLSGSEHVVDLDRARSLGASAYLVKPISEAQLRAYLDWAPPAAAFSETGRSVGTA